MCKPVWRPLARADLDALCRIAAEAHPGLPERREVFEEKFRLFSAGCFALEAKGALAGYAISHPWRLYDVPPLDAFLEKLPDARDCLYLHDIAVTTAARGAGAAAELNELLRDVARGQGLDLIALTSVHGTGGFWGRLGFEAVRDERLADKLEGYGTGALYMIRRI